MPKKDTLYYSYDETHIPKYNCQDENNAWAEFQKNHKNRKFTDYDPKSQVEILQSASMQNIEIQTIEAKIGSIFLRNEKHYTQNVNMLHNLLNDDKINDTIKLFVIQKTIKSNCRSVLDEYNISKCIETLLDRSEPQKINRIIQNLGDDTSIICNKLSIEKKADMFYGANTEYITKHIGQTDCSEIINVLNNSAGRSPSTLKETKINIAKVAIATLEQLGLDNFISKLNYTNKCVILKDKDTRDKILPILSLSTKLDLLEELKKDKFNNKDIRNALKASIKEDIKNSQEIKSPDAKYNTAFNKLKNEIVKESSQKTDKKSFMNMLTSWNGNNKKTGITI